MMEFATDAPFYSWSSGLGGDFRNHFTSRSWDLQLIKLLKGLNSGRGVRESCLLQSGSDSACCRLRVMLQLSSFSLHEKHHFALLPNGTCHTRNQQMIFFLKHLALLTSLGFMSVELARKFVLFFF